MLSVPDGLCALWGPSSGRTLGSITTPSLTNACCTHGSSGQSHPAAAAAAERPPSVAPRPTHLPAPHAAVSFPHRAHQIIMSTPERGPTPPIAVPRPSGGGAHAGDPTPSPRPSSGRPPSGLATPRSAPRRSMDGGTPRRGQRHTVEVPENAERHEGLVVSRQEKVCVCVWRVWWGAEKRRRGAPAPLWPRMRAGPLGEQAARAQALAGCWA